MASSRSRRPPQSKLKMRFKNRTLIRARSIILPLPAASRPRPLLSGPAAVAVARRSSFGVRRSAPGAGFVATGAPTKFVHSGKYGMAIRRENSSDLAARRAAVATTTTTTTTTQYATGKTSATSNKSRAIPVAGARGRTSVSMPVAGKMVGGKTVAAAAAKKGGSALASVALSARKAELLKKARLRSVASRKASAVVAGARVKRARVLVRNMTLYRGKAGVGMGGTEGQGKGGGPRGAEKNAKVKTEPCLFFCKFGKCSKSQEECRFVHDKSKVAVCRAFLRGKCEKKDACLLTHAVQAEKMPVCIYFERGMCFTPNCPYLHVKVSRNAAVCPNFLKGYCPDGTACRLKHELPSRKRTREASTERDQGEEGTTAGKKMKTKASETGTAASASASTTGADASNEGKSGKFGSALSKAAGVVVVAAAVGGGGGASAAGRRKRDAESSMGGASEADGSAQAEVGGAGVGSEGGVAGFGKGDVDHEEEDEESDHDLKPRFLWKKRL